MRVDSPQLWALAKTAMFTALVPFVVAFWLPHRILSAYAAPPHTGAVSSFLAALVSYPFLLFGVVVYLWCAWDFATQGLGSPAPIDAPKKLVVSGPYRYVRNPMYGAVLSVIASGAIAWQSQPMLIYLIFVAAGFHLFVIAYEERHLRQVFGEQYVQYCRRVSRWRVRRPRGL